MTRRLLNDHQATFAISAPLVSVIVVNHNYGRFLHAAVASVLCQTYPRVECIVVDNASTDESSAVLESMAESGLAVHVIRRPSNDGQTPASLDGLAAARGAYVIFVDADDLLLPTCVEAHVYAHLSLRVHVGFTSGDMLQVTGEGADLQVVVATGEDFNRYIRSGKGLKRGLVRPYRTADTAWPDAEIMSRLEGRLHHVPPLRTSWVWSPTSGNCYRRDALTMFADLPDLSHLRTGTDMYFGHGIGAVSGSALVDEPVFAYRIHGGNVYTRRAQLDRTLCFRPGGSGDSNDLARLLIIDQLVGQAERFAPNIWLRLNLVALLVRLDRPQNDKTLPRWKRRSRLASRLSETDGGFTEVMGQWLSGFLKLWSGVPFRRW